MTTLMKKIPRIPKIPQAKPEKFSGLLEGGSLWQNLCIEESLLLQVLLQLDPISLMNLEISGSQVLRQFIINRNVWQKKLEADYPVDNLDSDVMERLDLLDIQIPKEIYSKSTQNHLASKNKVVHLWHLELNWRYGQYVDKIDHVLAEKETQVIHYHDRNILIFDSDLEDEMMQCYNLRTKEVTLLSEQVSQLIDAYYMYVCSDYMYVCSDLKTYIFANTSEGTIVVYDEETKPQFPQTFTMPSEFSITGLIQSEQYISGFKPEKLVIWKIDISDPSSPPEEVWGKSLNQIGVFPKLKFTTVTVDFPIAYVVKSNQIIEIWNIAENRQISEVDHTEIAPGQTILRILLNKSEVVTEAKESLSVGKTYLYTFDRRVLEKKISNKIESSPVQFSRILIETGFGSQIVIDGTTLSYVEEGGEGKSILKVIDFWNINSKNRERVVEESKTVQSEDGGSKTKEKKPKLVKEDSVHSKPMKVESEIDHSESDDDDYRYHEDEELVHEDNEDYYDDRSEEEYGY